MDSANLRRVNAISAALAGLQAGMLGVLWMLFWLGITAKWQQRSFWTPENLLASTFYGGAAIRRGLSSSTFSGLALYFLIYSTLACLLAVTMRLHLPPVRRLLVCIVAAVSWYYLSFHLIWRTLSPLVTLLHAERPTLIGHIIYGAIVSRFPRYFPAAPPKAPAEPPPAPASLPGSAPERIE